MARYRIDDVSVSRVRRSLAVDPATFHACADRLSVTLLSARSAVEADGDALARALERFRLVHVGSFHAIADAAAALGGDLDLVISSEQYTESHVGLAFTAGCVIGADS